MKTVEKIIIANLAISFINVIGMLITTIFNISLPPDRIFFSCIAVLWAGLIAAALRFL